MQLNLLRAFPPPYDKFLFQNFLIQYCTYAVHPTSCHWKQLVNIIYQWLFNDRKVAGRETVKGKTAPSTHGPAWGKRGWRRVRFSSSAHHLFTLLQTHFFFPLNSMGIKKLCKDDSDNHYIWIKTIWMFFVSKEQTEDECETSFFFLFLFVLHT